NHHVEPAFRCQIVVDFQYVPRILPRRFVSRLKPVHFLLVTTIRINIGYDGKKILAYHFEPALPPALRPPSDEKPFFGPPTFRPWLRPCPSGTHNPSWSV